MIRDIVRAVLAVVVMTVAAGLLIETRFHLAAIDVAHRASIAGQPAMPLAASTADTDGPLRRLGRATLGLADAAVALVR